MRCQGSLTFWSRCCCLPAPLRLLMIRQVRGTLASWSGTSAAVKVCRKLHRLQGAHFRHEAFHLHPLTNTDAGKAGGKQGEEAPKLLAGSTATDATTTSGALAIPGSTAAAKKKAPSAPTTWSALEGFQQIMKRSAELRDAQPEVSML